MNKCFTWEPIRSLQLLEERGISFEDVVFYIQKGNLLDCLRYRNPQRDPQQGVLVVEIDHYTYLVPFVETHEAYCLQTITPCRIAKKVYSGSLS
ncbi:MAG: toxin [Gammaproteobacteria bacterium]|nr:toxin [Gammaproteobacteria bacterium]